MTCLLWCLVRSIVGITAWGYLMEPALADVLFEYLDWAGISALAWTGRGPRASFCSRLFNFFLPDAPAAKAARTLDWT